MPPTKRPGFRMPRGSSCALMPLHDAQRGARARPRPAPAPSPRAAPTRSSRARPRASTSARHSVSAATTAFGSRPAARQHRGRRCRPPRARPSAPARPLRWARPPPCSMQLGDLGRAAPPTSSPPRPARGAGRAEPAARAPGVIARGAVEHAVSTEADGPSRRSSSAHCHSTCSGDAVEADQERGAVAPARARAQRLGVQRARARRE